MSVNISTLKGTAKHSVQSIEIDSNGVVGDAHHGTSGRNVSLLNRELVDELVASSCIESISYGAMGENITCMITGPGSPQTGDRILIGNILMRIEKIGKECHGEGCSIFREIGRCVMPSSGIFCSVIRGGRLEPGMKGELVPES